MGVMFLISGLNNYVFEKNIQRNNTGGFDVMWPIPQNAEEGIYKITCGVMSEYGDEDVTNNYKEMKIRVGNKPPLSNIYEETISVMTIYDPDYQLPSGQSLEN